MPAMTEITIDVRGEDETAAVARRLGRRLGAGDTLLLKGEIGAGKSVFARALIQDRLAALGRHEDVPSPTYTLVQTYDAGEVEIWHADLFRLSGPEAARELGLSEAFDDSICLIEWPEVLGDGAPSGALRIGFRGNGDPGFRRMTMQGPADRWAERLAWLVGSDA